MAELAKQDDSRAIDRQGYEMTSATEMPRNLQEVINIAKIMAASGFYQDAQTAQKAAAIMLLGIQFGIPPAQALTAIHVVKGKPMLHYSAILSKVRQHPDYDYEIVEATAKRAEILFIRRNKRGEWVEAGRSVFTHEDAVRQGTGADNSSGPGMLKKFPDTMLFARAASNGVKRYAPDVLNGMPVYTAGEIEPDEVYVQGPSKAKALMAEIQSEEPQPSEDTTDAEVLEAEPEDDDPHADDERDRFADDEVPEGALI